MRPQPPPYFSPPSSLPRYLPPHPYHPQVLPYPNPQVFTAMPPHAGTITAEPLSPISAQTHNVITVDHWPPSYRPLGNQGGIFPVNVIPSENSAIHRVATQIQNPLVDAPGGSRHENSSRAQEVLGNGRRFAQGPHANSSLSSHMGSEWFISFTEVPLPHNAAQTKNIITVVHQAPVILPVKTKVAVVEAATSTGPVPVLHSTCLTALQGCNDDPLCRRLLDPVLGVCGNECDREACMKNLRVFYRNVGFKWALEVAFCLCKKSSATADKCLAAQEKLHPSCARRPEGAGPMLCNRLAHNCKEDKSCRHRLEFYEQACAVDSDTRRCAGSTSECRRALLGILGTQLRNLCTCAAKDAADPRETYNCLDWQRILWFNPCVVESQTDYHREMLAGVGPEDVITTSANIVTTYTTTQSYTSGQVATDHVPLVIQPPGTNIPSPYTPPYNEGPPKHQTALPLPTAPPTTTTSTTTQPPRYCEKGGDDNSGAEYIIEGGGRRYYKAYDSTCSELCLCHPNDQLVCRVLDCIEAHTCSNGVAMYTHAMPAYLHKRGKCICYSGNFVCVRPDSKEYTYDDLKGVYLFLGYSKAEEKLLNPYTNMNVDDIVPRLRELVLDEQAKINGTDCQLEVVEHIDENMILQAMLEDYYEDRDNMSAIQLHDIKDKCAESLKIVADRINSKDPEVRADVALSMVLLAQVHIRLPPIPAAAGILHAPPCHILLGLTLLLIELGKYTLPAS
ncbi:unnamed protein product [Meganyctiphanes norvegica]|uniref:GDNF/GAS1 domain-containing protein n=1 Tax=Meganyctiphanes norvegica TaxID=48144 RepID=A0AAV2Q9C6_MEGNR